MKSNTDTNTQLGSFHVGYRNYGHWDITRSSGRLFRIRGAPGRYCVIDEREESVRKVTKDFKTVSACMSYITDELMYELIFAEGQTLHMIEGWN